MSFGRAPVPGSVSEILAIRLARLGDVALLLPSLGLLRAAFGGGRLTLLTSLPYEPLARLSPWVDDVLAVDRLRIRDGTRRQAFGEIAGLLRRLRSRRFDLAVDFHSFRETNLLVWASGARYRIGMQRSDRAYLPFCFNMDPVLEDKSLHVAEMFRQVVLGIPGLEDPGLPSMPSIRVPERRPGPQFTVALYVGASAASRRWPRERFAALARHLVDHWSASVLVVTGTGRDETNAAVEVGREAGRPEQVRVVGESGIPELVETLAAADVLVSNDSGPMHIGSALGVPTLGIFSESLPRHYGPVGTGDRYIWKNPVETVSLEEVLETLGEMRRSMVPPDATPRR